MANRTAYLLLVVLCLVSQALRAADVADNALDALQGSWELISVISDGETLPEQAIAGGKAVFSKNTMTLISPDAKERTEYIIKLDPSQTPHAIDIVSTEGTFKGETNRGIYEVRANRLQVCQPHQPTIARPSTFDAPQGSRLHLMVLRKISD